MEREARSPRIVSRRWGQVFVETERRPLRDAVLFPGGAHEWDWRASGTGHWAGIQPSAVAELLERGARVVVLSRGVLGALRVAPETLDMLAEHGVPAHVLRTPAAIESYNVLAVTERVGALIHSTC
jgi:hypothetical protein